MRVAAAVSGDVPKGRAELGAAGGALACVCHRHARATGCRLASAEPCGEGGAAAIDCRLVPGVGESVGGEGGGGGAAAGNQSTVPGDPHQSERSSRCINNMISNITFNAVEKHPSSPTDRQQNPRGEGQAQRPYQTRNRGILQPPNLPPPIPSTRPFPLMTHCHHVCNRCKMHQLRWRGAGQTAENRELRAQRCHKKCARARSASPFSRLFFRDP